MSYDLQSVVHAIFLNNEASIGIVTVVAYDYILTFPKEIEYVWNRRWTWVTLLFVLVRYVGMYAAMGIALLGTTFVPGPEKLYGSIFSDILLLMIMQIILGTSVIYSAQWAYLIFLAASDMLMILRVWVMWRQSKIILGILLFFYVVEVGAQLVGSAFFDNPRIDATVEINRVLDYVTCTEVLSVLGPYLKFTLINPILFDLLLLSLALFVTLKDSMEMYKETKLWQPNRYMTLIVKEGILYIFLNMFNSIFVVASQVHNGALPPTWVVIFGLVGTPTLYPVVPRFVLGIRELYDKESRNGIDGGFGATSSSGWNDGLGMEATTSALAFAEGEIRMGSGGDEEMQLDPVLKRDDERYWESRSFNQVIDPEG